MDRRAVLGGLAAAAFAALPVFAQTGGAAPAPRSGNSGGGSTGTGPAMRQMGQAEIQHMQQTLQLGMVALETSRIAMSKARNEDLKRFATFEVQEQTTLSEILQSMMEPAATGSASGGQQSSGMPATMPNMQSNAQAQSMVQQLQSQQAGPEFDRAYLEGQIKGHRDLLQVQEQYLQSSPQSREHMNVAKMAREHIREHIAMLEVMEKAMR